MLNLLAIFLVLFSLGIPSNNVSAQCDPSSNDSQPWNGYCDRWGNQVPGLITNDFWMTSAPEHFYGKMTFYAYGAMDATAEYRGISYNDCIGGVSLMSPNDIGRKVWIKIDGEWYGPFCSVDCARRGDIYSIIVIREEAVEVNIRFAEEMGMVKINPDYTHEVIKWYKDVEVYLPPENYQAKMPPDHGNPISYKDWFLKNIEFATRYESSVIDLGNYTWKQYGQDKYWVSKYRDYPFEHIYYLIFGEYFVHRPVLR